MELDRWEQLAGLFQGGYGKFGLSEEDVQLRNQWRIPLNANSDLPENSH